MDFDFISQFYYGNINPSFNDIPRGSTLAKACKAFSESEDFLTAALDGENKRALLRLLDAHSEIVGTSEHDAFGRGFCLGVLMMLDVLSGAEDALGEREREENR